MAKGMLLTTVRGSTGNKYEIRMGKDHKVYCTCKGWTFTPRS